MYKIFYYPLFLLVIFSAKLSAQATLPDITVKNYNGKIVVSWKNDYKLEVKVLNIQRSYDSTKNFTTIGSVLNPQNIENGYADENPPYNRMYYRAFISFDGGMYLFSKSGSPIKEFVANAADIVLPGMHKSTDKQSAESRNKDKSGDLTNPFSAEELITFPSKRIYTGKDNNLVITLTNAGTHKYQIKFFTETEEPLFELNSVKENFLIMEKGNFSKSGWYLFQLYDNGKLIEKNKFYIPRDIKLQ